MKGIFSGRDLRFELKIELTRFCVLSVLNYEMDDEEWRYQENRGVWATDVVKIIENNVSTENHERERANENEKKIKLLYYKLRDENINILRREKYWLL